MRTILSNLFSTTHVASSHPFGLLPASLGIVGSSGIEPACLLLPCWSLWLFQIQLALAVWEFLVSLRAIVYDMQVR